jgi:predicted  nucleic acid-binding Zn-ribbon protein
MDERIRELNGQLRASDDKCEQLRNEIEKVKFDLKRSQDNESELKRTIEQTTKLTIDHQVIRDQVGLMII